MAGALALQVRKIVTQIAFPEGKVTLRTYSNEGVVFLLRDWGTTRVVPQPSLLFLTAVQWSSQCSPFICVDFWPNREEAVVFLLNDCGHDLRRAPVVVVTLTAVQEELAVVTLACKIWVGTIT